jgi:hypothetical protein
MRDEEVARLWRPFAFELWRDYVGLWELAARVRSERPDLDSGGVREVVIALVARALQHSEVEIGNQPRGTLGLGDVWSGGRDAMSVGAREPPGTGHALRGGPNDRSELTRVGSRASAASASESQPAIASAGSAQQSQRVAGCACVLQQFLHHAASPPSIQRAVAPGDRQRVPGRRAGVSGRGRLPGVHRPHDPAGQSTRPPADGARLRDEPAQAPVERPRTTAGPPRRARAVVPVVGAR